jgi:uncharacterized membrane protein YoaK (UPF0700 family)
MAVQLKPTLPVLLSFNGGYVDGAGYLALQGLFTAHVTGNFVTLGAALVFGTAGVLTKLLALLDRIVARSMPEETVSKWLVRIKQSKTDTTYLDARRRT